MVEKTIVMIVNQKVTEVPLRRFRRELRKWLRLNETVAITRCGVIVAYLVPAEEYDACLAQLASAVAL